jgi:hypothetical protein
MWISRVCHIGLCDVGGMRIGNTEIHSGLGLGVLAGIYI